jgi:tetratricopeptide (TPR) repeat protein
VAATAHVANRYYLAAFAERALMQRFKRLLRNLVARSAPAAVGLAFVVCASSPGLAEPHVHTAAGAMKSLEAGISAYQEGAIEVAVETLSDALLQENLSQTKAAQALYYRGLAYRELGKPGQAIADLTKAMAVKNALSKGDLKVAARNRAGAYREAGLADTETPVRPVEQSRVRVQVPSGRLPVPAGGDAVAAGDDWGTTSSIDRPAPSAPSTPSWGETSVEFAPAAAQ